MLGAPFLIKSYIRRISNLRVILIHGNGASSSGSDHWFPYVKRELERDSITALAPDFPEPQHAQASVWLSFLKDKLHVDKDTVLVGHSSGAVAAMRFAEQHKICGSVLVSACYTDLGDPNEKASGYFNTSWDWDAIRCNQNWIIQFASIDDPFISIREPRYIHTKLQTEYYEYQDHGHFGLPRPQLEFPELVEKVRFKIIKT